MMEPFDFCMDCPEYCLGGFCRKYHKTVGALQAACDDMIKKMKVSKKEEMEQTLIPETKRCTKCGRELPREAFNPKANSSDGLQSWCRECTNESSRRTFAKRWAEERGLPAPEDKPWPIKPGDPVQARKRGPQQTLAKFESQALADELRARGYKVKCVKISEEL